MENAKKVRMTPAELKRVRMEALDRRLSVGSPVAALPLQNDAAPETVAAAPKTPSAMRAAPKTPGGPETPAMAAARRVLASPAVSVEDPLYSPLIGPLLDGESASQLKLTKQDGKSVVNDLLKNLWVSGSQNMKQFEKKRKEFENKSILILENCARRNKTVKAKASLQRWSLRKHKRMGTFTLDSQYLKYDLYAPLHEMWKEYMKKLINGCTQSMMLSRLLTAELHGAPMEVVASKLSGYTGIKGLMIRETENTFGIITLDNKFKVVPKRGSIFVIYLDTLKITMFGNNLSARSDQSSNKEKKSTTVEL